MELPASTLLGTEAACEHIRFLAKTDAAISTIRSLKYLVLQQPNGAALWRGCTALKAASMLLQEKEVAPPKSNSRSGSGSGSGFGFGFANHGTTKAAMAGAINAVNDRLCQLYARASRSSARQDGDATGECEDTAPQVLNASLATVSIAIDQRLITRHALHLIRKYWQNSPAATDLMSSIVHEAPAAIFSLSPERERGTHELSLSSGAWSRTGGPHDMSQNTQVLVQTPSSLRLRLIRRLHGALGDGSHDTMPGICSSHAAGGRSPTEALLPSDPSPWEYSHVELDEAFHRTGDTHPEETSSLRSNEQSSSSLVSDQHAGESEELDVTMQLLNDPLIVVDSLQASMRDEKLSKGRNHREDSILS